MIDCVFTVCICLLLVFVTSFSYMFYLSRKENSCCLMPSSNIRTRHIKLNHMIGKKKITKYL